jgi:diguanylate cyclase (GGDEF)-like protein
MLPQIISPSDLEQLLSSYEYYEQEKGQETTLFLQFLIWAEQKQMLQLLVERICQPGEIIIQENKIGDVFYLIRTGQVVVIKGDYRHPTILGFRGSGEAIGEMALLENRPRFATVIALDTTTLWCLSREMFHQFLSENPVFGLELMNMLSARIRESDDERLRGSVREQQQVEVLEDLSEQVIHDSLTGLFNRRHLDRILGGEIARAHRNGSTVGLLLADIDHFKEINDRYGHKAGDVMLQELSKLLKKCVRSADVVCRYGGEEFVVIMPGVSMSTLSRCAEKIRYKVQELLVEFGSDQIHTTISLGAAVFPLHGSNGDEILVCADQALYQAKREGRNRVVICPAGTVSEKNE